MTTSKKSTQTPKNNIILGIDPGTARMGYGVIRSSKPQLECIEHNTITTAATTESPMRLYELHKRLREVISKFRPDAIAVEDLFYAKNQKTVIEVAQARGIALLSAAEFDIPCYGFTPLQVKQAVTGYGQADKKQIQAMVKTLLKLEETPRLDDAADALAVAICCAHSLYMLEQTKT